MEIGGDSVEGKEMTRAEKEKDSRKRKHKIVIKVPSSREKVAMEPTKRKRKKVEDNKEK